MIDSGTEAAGHFGRATLFSVTFAVVYALCFYYSWGLFAYYPQVNEVHLSGSLAETIGPPILWYGWLCIAGLVGAILAMAVPASVSSRVWHGCAWAVPTGVIVAVLIYEKRWFF